MMARRSLRQEQPAETAPAFEPAKRDYKNNAGVATPNHVEKKGKI